MSIYVSEKNNMSFLRKFMDAGFPMAKSRHIFFRLFKKNIVKIKLHCKYFIFKFIGWFRNSFWWVFFLKFLHFKFQVQTELVHVHIKPCTLIKTTIHNLHSYWFPFVHTCKFIFCSLHLFFVLFLFHRKLCDFIKILKFILRGFWIM